MTHILIPREPSTALLRPFIGCQPQELPEAYAAMLRIAEVQHARAGSQCLAQIEEPAQSVAPVLDDRWKARMLDGRAPVRDEMGFGNHPELPWLDEGMMPRSFFAALGLELAHTSAEDQLDGDVLGAMSEAVNWSRWMPTAPQGDGWKLVSIFDTEDGPAAWWLRALPEAEDGTTTIRNLQAEVEKLKARIARAGAAPAAVAPFGYVNTHTGQFFKDVEPCRQGNEGHWRTVYLQPSAVAGAAPAGWQLVPATPTRDWIAAVADGGYEDCNCAQMIASILSHAPAAPALEAPAHQCCNSWFLSLPEGRQAVLRENQWMLADAAYQAGRESSRALEAPAAPPVPVDEFRVDTPSLVRNIVALLELDADGALVPHGVGGHARGLLSAAAARLAAAPQAPAAPSADYTLVDEGGPSELAGAQAQYSIEREDGTTLAWVNGDKAAAEELMAALRLPMPISRSEWIAEVRSFLCQGGWDEPVAISTARDLCEAQDWLGQDIEDPRDAAWNAFLEDMRQDPHSDDLAVDRFAAEMKAKLAAARAKGRGGWETCPPEVLSRMLREHTDKGDPRDVANFCMFLWCLGQPIGAAPAAPAVDADPLGLRDVGEAFMQAIERNSDALKAVGWLGPMDCPSEIVVDLLNLLEEANTTSALGEWVATLEVDSGGGLDYETVPPCTLPPGCYPLYLAAQAKEGGAA